MEIIETVVFTKAIVKLMPDDEYKMLQHYLVCRPDAGVLIVGGGGLRKIRWSVPGRGKAVEFERFITGTEGNRFTCSCVIGKMNRRI
jgi:hypothetical protein